MKVFSTGQYYSNGRNIICHAMKGGSHSAILQAAAEMSLLIKELAKDSVLVPVPSHLGYATYTLELAKEVAKRTGIRVADVLKGEHRRTLYEMKASGEVIPKDYLKMHIQGHLPSERIILVDNVLATGQTAQVALEAVRSADLLVYAVDGNTLLTMFTLYTVVKYTILSCLCQEFLI